MSTSNVLPVSATPANAAVDNSTLFYDVQIGGKSVCPPARRNLLWDLCMGKELTGGLLANATKANAITNEWVNGKRNKDDMFTLYRNGEKCLTIKRGEIIRLVVALVALVPAYDALVKSFDAIAIEREFYATSNKTPGKRGDNTVVYD